MNGIIVAWVLTAGSLNGAADLPEPSVLVRGKMSGHVHPSVCVARSGAVLVFYRGDNVLMRVRSKDGGLTWDKPVPVGGTSERPDFIPVVPKFEVYPGTADTLSDGRILLTWNYIAQDPEKDYYARPLLFSVSSDEGETWTKPRSFGQLNGEHLGAMRNPVLEWSAGEWLLARREQAPVLYHTETGNLTPYTFRVESRKRPSCLQMVRTPRGTLLAMGSALLRSGDGGKSWEAVPNFPGPSTGENANGRSLTVLKDGSVLLTWGEGRDNKGFRLAHSTDDGRTWKSGAHRLPDTEVAARFGAPRTVQLDEKHLGTVYFNREGLFFARTPMHALK